MVVHKKTFRKVKSTARRAVRSVSRFGKRATASAGQFAARRAKRAGGGVSRFATTRAKRAGTAVRARGRSVAKSVGGQVKLGARKATRSLVRALPAKKGPSLRKITNVFKRANPISGILKTTQALRNPRRFSRGARSRRRFRR